MWRMGISPCSNLVTATSPGQAPLPSPPSKCKLTADKAYGASPALRASVFIISYKFALSLAATGPQASEGTKLAPEWSG